MALSAGPAAAAPFDPAAHKAFAGPASEVLVLGTPHLSEFPKMFDPTLMAPLLDRLAAWRPQIITIEAVSGVQCEELRRYAALHSDAADGYCWDPAPAAKATGRDVASATLEVERRLTAWPAAPSAQQRRELAALFLASGDRASALVQWLRLPAAERRVGDGLDATLVALLEKTTNQLSENYQIAAVLAARLGLERVYQTDDHTADGPDAGDQKAAGAAIGKAWDNPASKRRLVMDKALDAGLSKRGGVMALYRSHNDPALAANIFASDFGAALREPSAPHYGRRYVAWWETRNLRMVANIRATLIDRPGARLLTVVGSSHKPYFDAYLRQMHDVRLADTAAVLR